MGEYLHYWSSYESTLSEWLIEEFDSSGKERVVLLHLCSAGVTLSRGSSQSGFHRGGRERGGYPAWMSSKVVQGRAGCLWSPSVLYPFLKRVSLFSKDSPTELSS